MGRAAACCAPHLDSLSSIKPEITFVEHVLGEKATLGNGKLSKRVRSKEKSRIHIEGMCVVNVRGLPASRNRRGKHGVGLGVSCSEVMCEDRVRRERRMEGLARHTVGEHC